MTDKTKILLSDPYVGSKFKISVPHPLKIKAPTSPSISWELFQNQLIPPPPSSSPDSTSNRPLTLLPLPTKYISRYSNEIVPTPNLTLFYWSSTLSLKIHKPNHLTTQWRSWNTPPIIMALIETKPPPPLPLSTQISLIKPLSS